MTAPRPSTHPVEAYRRSRAALDVALADVVHLLGHLDPVDRWVAGTDLVEDLAAWAERVDEAAVDGEPTPWHRRTVVDVDTGGRT